MENQNSKIGTFLRGRILGNRVLVEASESTATTDGGIYIPTESREKKTSGRVIAVGKGSPERPMELKAGEFVLYNKFGGTELEIKGKRCIILDQSEVSMVMDDDPITLERVKEIVQLDADDSFLHGNLRYEFKQTSDGVNVSVNGGGGTMIYLVASIDSETKLYMLLSLINYKQ
jgi:chaperonin GroES